jgi:hypothetical protein
MTATTSTNVFTLGSDIISRRALDAFFASTTYLDKERHGREADKIA